jgi:glycosyltransferase involved in cell wall biosynthesis
VNRELELAMEKTGCVDLTVLPVGSDMFAGSLNSKAQKVRKLYHRRSPGPVDIHVRHQWPPNWNPPFEGRWVVIQPWEYGSLPVDWVEAVNAGVDEVWVPSTFVQRLYMESGIARERVHVVPNGVDTDFFRPGLPLFPLPSKESFKFLFVGGTIHRKGIDILLKAYQLAFRRDDPVSLIIKDMGTQSLYQGQGLGDQIRALQLDDTTPRVHYIEQDLRDTEIASLYVSCDCLVHPYRGEGFGLPVLEAMSCGLPVIVTAGGSTDDFVNDTTGYRLPAQRRVFGNREISGLRTVGDLWMLEPDVDALAERMQWVFKSREAAKQTGTCARRKVIESWSWERAASKAIERIQHLAGQPILRLLKRAANVALVDLVSFDPALPGVLVSTIESLRRNAYVPTEVFLWQRETEDLWGPIVASMGDVKILKALSLGHAIKELKEQVCARFLTLLDRPLAFSRQWFSQIAEVADRVGGGPTLLYPSSNIPESECHVVYLNPPNDLSFQRFARLLWREHRGRYREIRSTPPGIVVANWQCLDFSPPDDSSSWHDWIDCLQRSGSKSIWVEDTFVAEVPGTVAQPHR